MEGGLSVAIVGDDEIFGALPAGKGCFFKTAGIEVPAAAVKAVLFGAGLHRERP